MKKSGRYVFYGVMAALIALALFFGLYLSGGTGEVGGDFVLPDSAGVGKTGQNSGQDDLPKIPEGPKYGENSGVERMELNAQNVQGVIAALRRPEVYTITMLCENISPNMALRQKGTVSTDGSRTAARLADTSLLSGTRYLIEEDMVTIADIATGDSYEASLGDFSPDDLALFPTYEDIISLPAEAVKSAAIDNSLGIRCILAVTEDPDTGYTETYYIAIDYGLLVRCETVKDGQTIYRATLEDISLEAAGADFFDV